MHPRDGTAGKSAAREIGVREARSRSDTEGASKRRKRKSDAKITLFNAKNNAEITRDPACSRY